MKLICNGSGSSGNSYLLITDSEVLILECGLPFKTIKKILNFDITKIVGIACTHVHMDHFRFHKEYEQAGIPLFKPFETDKKVVRYGGFAIQAFKLVHSVDCYGFYITHKDLGKMLFITDTEYVPQDFSKLKVNHILVEANYDMELIEDTQESYKHSLTGHMEITTTEDFIKHNMSDSLETVLLCHLSGRNADEEDFLDRLRKIVPKGVKTEIARNGLEVCLKDG